MLLKQLYKHNINTLTSNVATNATTAATATTAVQTNVNANETASNTANTTLQNNINSLSNTTNAAIALKENAANKSTDVSTDGTSDVKFPTVKSVKTYVDAEITTSNGTNGTALAALKADVDQNESDSDAAETTLQTNINTLTSNVATNATTAATATAAVQTNVNANETASNTANTTLQNNINSLSTTTNAAIALKENAANKSTDVSTDGTSDVKFPTVKSVKTYVDAEITTSNGTNGTALAALKADVDQNESDSDAAETTLQTNINTLTSNVATNATTAATATAAVQTNVNANETASNTANTTLQNNINSLSNTTNAAIALKENAANKSTDVSTDGTSDVKFPTVKSVKTYVDAEITTSNGTNGTALAALKADIDKINTLEEDHVYLGNSSDEATETPTTGSGDVVRAISPTLTGTTTLDGALSVSGATTLDSTLDVTAAVNLNDTTQSTDTTNGALIVDGGVGIAQNLNVGGNFEVTGTTTAAAINVNSIFASGKLTVTGATTLNGGLTMGLGDFTVAPISGNTVIGGTLSVAGGLTGDVYASNGTSKILESGTDGTDAVFTGDVTGDVTGNVTGNLTGDVTGNAATATKISSIVNADIVQLEAIQTLTNKTLTSPILVTPNLGIASATSLTASYLTAAGNNLSITAQGAYMMWNIPIGDGSTNFINSKGQGAGGFSFYNIATGTAFDPVATPPIVEISPTGAIKAGAVTYTYLDGLAGQVLTTNGAGGTSWENSAQADVDQNKLDSDAAAAAIQDDVDANEAASVAADATLQTNIDNAITNTVKLTGDQTIAGVKTFSSAILSDVTGNVTGDVTGNAGTATKIASIANDDIVQLEAIQTLTNKTLTSPTITGTTTAAAINANSIAASGKLTVTGATTLNGGLTMGLGDFTVAPLSGNTVIRGTLSVTGGLTGNVTGNVTGGLTGDVYASDGTSKILENGTDGTDAIFTGDVTGNITGNAATVNNGVYTTSSVAALSDVTSAGSGAIITAAERIKLDGVDAAADVTNATNVAAAGAVMNTGNEMIAGVKTFSSTITGNITGNAATVNNGVYTTSSVAALSDVTSAGSGAIITAAERIKLDGVAAAADVTNATNVAAAGAVMNTGNEMIAGVKTFSSTITGNITGNAATVNNGVYTTSSVAALSDVTSAGSGAIITAAERIKLDGVAAAADVTNATNVAAAGAVMNTGNEMIAGVKTFSSTITGNITGNAATVNNGVYTTSSVAALSDVTSAGSGAIITAAERIKLDGVAAAADVTNATNVAAAGAVMNTGDETIAGVKTFSSTISGSIAGNAATVNNGVYTTSSVAALSDVTSAGSGAIITAAERTKLNGIETSADFTDATNVAAAGAVMNTGDETIAGVKRFSSYILGNLAGNITGNAATVTNGVYTTSSVAALSDVTSAGSGAIITAAERTKLAEATVTNATNVAAAGAVMNTGDETIAGVKTFSSTISGSIAGNAATVNNGVYTTSSVAALSDVTSAGSGAIITAAERTKLNGTETSADVTDATNVAAAGAVMNTGDETIAGVKTFSSTISGSIAGNAATVTNGVYTTSSVAALSDVTSAGSGAIITAAERTKLAEATVTNATNVAAAGAVMNTGDETIAGVKTFSSTISGSIAGNADTATKIASITNTNIVQLTETQTLTNKTLTSPTLVTPTLGVASATSLTASYLKAMGNTSSITDSRGLFDVEPS